MIRLCTVAVTVITIVRKRHLGNGRRERDRSDAEAVRFTAIYMSEGTVTCSIRKQGKNLNAER